MVVGQKHEHIEKTLMKSNVLDINCQLAVNGCGWQKHENIKKTLRKSKVFDINCQLAGHGCGVQKQLTGIGCGG